MSLLALAVLWLSEDLAESRMEVPPSSSWWGVRSSALGFGDNGRIYSLAAPLFGSLFDRAPGHGEAAEQALRGGGDLAVPGVVVGLTALLGGCWSFTLGVAVGSSGRIGVRSWFACLFCGSCDKGRHHLTASVFLALARLCPWRAGLFPINLEYSAIQTGITMLR